MKNITIIIVSVILANLKLSPALNDKLITNHPVKGEELVMEDIIIPEKTLSGIVPSEEEELAPLPEEKSHKENAPAGGKNIGSKFRARKMINIQSAENVANRTLHQQLAKSDRVALAENVLFDFDRYDVRNSDEFNKILAIADDLIFHPELKVSLSGNTDHIGSDYYNDVLSYNRVENVKAYLLEIGVSADQITVSFNGEEMPAADNDTDDGRAENRRVEMFLYQ